MAVWLFGFAVSVFFIGATSRLLVHVVTLTPIGVLVQYHLRPPFPAGTRFRYVFPFYFVLGMVGALIDGALRGGIGGMARLYWWSCPVKWDSGPVYGVTARFYPQALLV